MEFDYLIKKVQDAEFSFDPFKHIIIDDFLSSEHFERVVTSKEIIRPEYSNTKELLEDLFNIGYEISGSDLKKTNITKYLEKLGIKISIGHRKKNIIGSGYWSVYWRMCNGLSKRWF